MNIIMDAMGGDHAPREIVMGAVEAVNKFSDIQITLTGDKKAIEEVLADMDYDKSRLSMIHTTQIIEMEDSPVKAIKEKADSSMVVALRELSCGNAQMMISAGSTGAL
ncbi:MAG: phosphate--acyl-ACP acyltransferase, partial [Christensenellaceae bacterium]